MYPLCTIYARCGYTRLVFKQTRSGVYYYVKVGSAPHWKRIKPCDLLDYIPSVEDLKTSSWVYAPDTGEWLFVENLPIIHERTPV